MKRLPVVIPDIKAPIKESPGFAKKLLSEYKLDILGLCEFGCVYCSSNHGNFLRINRERFADLTEQQAGLRFYPAQTPALSFVFENGLKELERQVERMPRSWGAGATLVFSMLTDGFSPALVRDGTTRRALELLVEGTAFKIRVLTKNAVVGKPEWIDFFRNYPGRFVVGLSVGTLDDEWSKTIEIGTSRPTARLRALAALQEAGVDTFGMLCPVFPDVLKDDGLERLVDAINPSIVEHVWAEPYNDRTNWRSVRDGYQVGSSGHQWLTEVYEKRNMSAWSDYAARLYERLRNKAVTEGWSQKLRYLLYERHITATDAPRFTGLQGVLLQGSPDRDGRSKNPEMAALL